MAKNKNKRKIREEKIYSTTKGEVTEISLSFDQNGNIEFETEMRNIYCETTYNRIKGEKVLSRVPLKNKAQFAINEAIENNFDIIFAIDTNTRVIRDYNVSVSGVIQCQKVFAVDPIGAASKCWQCWIPFCMEFIEVKSKPENLGWMMLIEYLKFKSDNIMKKRIGIITDSDLGNLNEYNLRTRPIYEEFLLPKNINLIYASSDGGKDLFPNHVLKLADKASNTCIEKLKSGHIPFNNKIINGKPYLGYRRLIPRT